MDGFQWQWQFRYLDDDSNPDNDYSVVGSPASPPVMVVPVGEPVRLTLMSRDVIHSFFVPQFLIKRDLIPFPEGVTPNKLEFTVSEEGTYHGQCAEFCGDLHAQMTFSVQAMSPRRLRASGWPTRKAGNTPPPSVQPGGEVVDAGRPPTSPSTSTSCESRPTRRGRFTSPTRTHSPITSSSLMRTTKRSSAASHFSGPGRHR